VIQHVVSVSGGKDSDAIYLRALELGRDFLPVFADTGHEHPATYEHVRLLAARTGGPEVQWVKADFSFQIARKARFVAEKWPEHGVPAERVARALELLKPTGIPYLDLCLWKGRFPSTRRKFCTEELKTLPITEQVMRPAIEGGARVISWQGVRAEESRPRALLPRSQVITIAGLSMRVWRPILHWTLADVLEIHRRHGLPLNPLYSRGFNRVGCFPCIHATKAEVRRIGDQEEAAIAKLEEWERLVGEASKRGRGSFFSHDKTPGAHQGRADIPMPGIREVVEWARTSRGGSQYTLLEADMGTVCGAWGHCE
jgi:3'-phosphoadenosine 5'-phosphosulfate sulfotransferase (PAPS reductase)/FAD synthetase